MKQLMITALFLVFLSAFPGTPARILPEHPLDKLVPLIQSTCIEKQSCHFSTVHGTVQAILTSRNFLYGEMADYGRTSRPPPPPPTSATPTHPVSSASATKEGSFTMAGYGRTSHPPPPPPTSAPPTEEVSITMPWYGRAAIPPPPSQTSAPPTKQTSCRYGRAWTPLPPHSPNHQVSITGLLLEKTPSSPSLAST